MKHIKLIILLVIIFIVAEYASLVYITIKTNDIETRLNRIENTINDFPDDDVTIPEQLSGNYSDSLSN